MAIFAIKLQQQYLLLDFDLQKSINCFNICFYFVIHNLKFVFLICVIFNNRNINSVQFIFISMTELTKQQLLKALTQPNNYKLTKPFLQQVLAGNLKVVEPINAVLTSVIKSNKVSLIGKLQTIRFFKEIFETGNMNIIDQISQEVEDHLVAVATYNKTSKELTRGANYFIQVQKRNASVKEIKQMGSSYVILATQIIKKFAEWYPVDENKEKTRFLQYLQFVKKSGVILPTNESYFKPIDTQKFQKNYKMWLQTQFKNPPKGQQGNSIQRKDAVLNKQNQIHKSESKQTDKKPAESLENKQKMKIQHSEEQNKLQNEEHKNIQQKKIINSTQSQQKIKSKLQINNANKSEQNKSFDNNKLSEIQKVKKVQEINQNHEKFIKLLAQNKQLRKQMQQSQTKQKMFEQQTKRLYKQVQQLQNLNSTQIQAKNKQQQIWKDQANNFQEQITAKQKQLAEFQFKYNEIVKQTSQNDGDKLSQLRKMSQHIQILNQERQNLIKSVNEYKDQLQHNKLEKQISQKTIQKQKEQILSFTKKLQQLGQENNNLNQKCQKLQIIVNQHKQNNGKIQQIQQTCIKYQQNALKNCKTVKNTSQQPCFILHKQQDYSLEKNNQDLLKMSMSKFLQNRKAQEDKCIVKTVNNERESRLNSSIKETKNEPRKSKSIGKTQNSLNRARQRLQQTHNSNFNRTDSLWGSASFGVQLKKTGIQKLRKNEQSRIISILPFIQQYFDPINLNQSFTFRSLCLIKQSAQSSPILSNDVIEVRLINAPKTLIVSVKNQTQEQQQIVISSQHSQVKICGQNTSKIVEPGMYTDFTIDARITNLNTRFPVCQLQVSSSNSLIYGFPLPICLFTFCRLTQLQQTQRLQQMQLKCYKSQKFVMNKLYRSIETCFQSLRFTSLGDRKQWFGKITYKYIPDIQLLMRIQQYKRNCTIQLDFHPQSAINDAFAKVLLQNLMFLLL